MICTVLIASALVLGPAKAPTYHSVQHFDNQIRLSQRVLDRTICEDIERIYPLTTVKGVKHLEERMKQTQAAALNMYVDHCEQRLLAEGEDKGECALTK